MQVVFERQIYFTFVQTPGADFASVSKEASNITALYIQFGRSVWWFLIKDTDSAKWFQDKSEGP